MRIAHVVEIRDERLVSLMMSKAQMHELARLRAARPDLTYAALHVHSLSGTLDVEVREAGGVKMIRLTATGTRLL